MIRTTLWILLLLAGAAGAQTNASYGETHRLKVKVEGTIRKAGLFLPKNLGKHAFVPLIVALPDGSSSDGKAFKEIGQFGKMAYENRFAILSVDIETSSNEGWHPKDAITMERDMEAVLGAIQVAAKKAKEFGVRFDPSVTALRGHSGACYLATYLGLRRPDLFPVVALNGVPNWFPEFLKFEGERNPDQRIHIYRGQSDVASVRVGTAKAIEELKKAGYKRIETEDIKGMKHESRPDVFVKWYSQFLRGTAKGRKAAGRIAVEADKIRADWKAGKAGVYAKMVKLVDKERKAGFGKVAVTLLAEASAAGKAALEEAENLEAGNEFLLAAEALRKVEKKYRGLPVSKQARALRSKLVKGDEYKAAEMLAKAIHLQEKGNDEKADALLVTITEKYKKTVAGEKAEQILDSR